MNFLNFTLIYFEFYFCFHTETKLAHLVLELARMRGDLIQIYKIVKGVESVDINMGPFEGDTRTGLSTCTK